MTQVDLDGLGYECPSCNSDACVLLTYSSAYPAFTEMVECSDCGFRWIEHTRFTESDTEWESR